MIYLTELLIRILKFKGPILLNTEFNSQRTRKSYLKNHVYIFHMLLKIFDEETNESYYKAVQLNINNYDRYRKEKFIYKEELIRKYDNDEEYVLTIYDINVAILRNLSYDDIRKLDRLGAKYLSLIFISNDKKLFEGDEMMLRIVKELNELSKTLDELLYYDPVKFKKEAALEDVTDEFRKEAVLETVTDEFKKEVVTEAVIEENKIATVKELIKNAVSKEIILKSTDLTEDKYNELLDEVNKESNKK